eukprot:282553-Alexandrium_andersonii.AAC.1
MILDGTLSQALLHGMLHCVQRARMLHGWMGWWGGGPIGASSHTTRRTRAAGRVHVQACACVCKCTPQEPKKTGAFTEDGTTGHGPNQNLAQALWSLQ